MYSAVTLISEPTATEYNTNEQISHPRTEYLVNLFKFIYTVAERQVED